MSLARYEDPSNTFRTVYDSIEADIRALRAGKLPLDDARTILSARRTQLRTAELALAVKRLAMQEEQFGWRHADKRKTA